MSKKIIKIILAILLIIMLVPHKTVLAEAPKLKKNVVFTETLKPKKTRESNMIENADGALKTKYYNRTVDLSSFDGYEKFEIDKQIFFNILYVEDVNPTTSTRDKEVLFNTDKFRDSWTTIHEKPVYDKTTGILSYTVFMADYSWANEWSETVYTKYEVYVMTKEDGSFADVEAKTLYDKTLAKSGGQARGTLAKWSKTITLPTGNDYVYDENLLVNIVHHNFEDNTTVPGEYIGGTSNVYFFYNSDYASETTTSFTNIANAHTNVSGNTLNLEFCINDRTSQNESDIDVVVTYLKLKNDCILNANGGVFADLTDTKRITPVDDIKQYTPTREGHIFLGWYSDPLKGERIFDTDGKALKYFTNGQYTGDKELILYAHWKQSATVLIIKNNIYMLGQDVSIEELLKQAFAYDVLDGNISNLVKITKIEYPDYISENPTSVDTSKVGVMNVTFSVTNSMNVTTTKTHGFEILASYINNDDELNRAIIFDRYFNGKLLGFNDDSIWKNDDEYIAELEKTLNTIFPIAQYVIDKREIKGE